MALAAVFVSEDPGRYLYKLDDDEYDTKKYENREEACSRSKTLSEKLTRSVPCMLFRYLLHCYLSNRLRHLSGLV